MSSLHFNHLEKLRFRSWHRGTREMDLLLGSFADKYLTNFSVEQLKAYEMLLEQNDPDLYDWITGKIERSEYSSNEIFLLLRQHQLVEDKSP